MEDIQIRWLIRRDMDEVLQIENDSFEFPWSEDDFLCCIRQRNVVGLVAETGFKSRDYRVVGFIVFELHPRHLTLVNFAVGKDDRCQGVGGKIIDRMKSKLKGIRIELNLQVRESNLAGQLFFQSHGFIATGIVRNPYEDSSEDAIAMKYAVSVDQLQTA